MELTSCGCRSSFQGSNSRPCGCRSSVQSESSSCYHSTTWILMTSCLLFYYMNMISRIIYTGFRREGMKIIKPEALLDPSRARLPCEILGVSKLGVAPFEANIKLTLNKYGTPASCASNRERDSLLTPDCAVSRSVLGNHLCIRSI